MSSLAFTCAIATVPVWSGCQGRDCPSVGSGDKDEMYTEAELFHEARSVTSHYERREYESVYLGDALKGLLRAWVLAPDPEPRLEQMIRDSIVLMCRPESSPEVMRLIREAPLDEIYPLEDIDQMSGVTCGTFVLANGKRVRGRQSLRSWE